MIQKRINIRVRYIIDGSKKKESKVSRIDGSKMMMLLLRIDLHLDQKKTLKIEISKLTINIYKMLRISRHFESLLRPNFSLES